MRNQPFNSDAPEGRTTVFDSVHLPGRHATVTALLCLTLLLCSLFAHPARAGVNLKNGNYYITYTDVILKGRHDLEIERTYNSRAGHMGMFGIGWGSDFEVRLEIPGDGTVVLHENGSGRRNTFHPPALSLREIEQSVDAIMLANEQVETYRDDAHRQETREKLLRDAELRAQSWTSHVRNGRLPPRHIAAGTVYRSQSMGQQRLLRTHDGYQRIKGSETEEFNADGKLVRVSFNDGTSFYVYRDPQGHIARIVSSDGQELRFHMNDNGTVARIDSSKGLSTFYEYDGKDLVRAHDSNGDSFNYRYDHNHNLIAIGYGDGTQRVITYTGHSQFVRAVSKRSGETTWYNYGTTYRRPDGEAYFTEVTRVSPSGRSLTNKYEYWIAYTQGGGSYTQRIRTTVRGIVTDTTYDANGTPTSIQRGRQDTQFEYDERGRLTLKTDGDMVIRLSYNDAVNKIAKVVKHPIGNPSDVRTYEYEYDANGNLTKASSSDGRAIALSYNEQGQIVRTESQDQIMSFVYNDIGKPIVISIEGVGSINVSYDANGEIEKVDSDGGHRIALQVTQSFQTLLSLVKPAGVNLNL